MAFPQYFSCRPPKRVMRIKLPPKTTTGVHTYRETGQPFFFGPLGSSADTPSAAIRAARLAEKLRGFIELPR
jgi:hypothetical protein